MGNVCIDPLEFFQDTTTIRDEYYGLDGYAFDAESPIDQPIPDAWLRKLFRVKYWKFTSTYTVEPGTATNTEGDGFVASGSSSTATNESVTPLIIGGAIPLLGPSYYINKIESEEQLSPNGIAWTKAINTQPLNEGGTDYPNPHGVGTTAMLALQMCIINTRNPPVYRLFVGILSDAWTVTAYGSPLTIGWTYFLDGGSFPESTSCSLMFDGVTTTNFQTGYLVATPPGATPDPTTGTLPATRYATTDIQVTPSEFWSYGGLYDTADGTPAQA